jgi:pyruvate formate lyase activating enzyme
MTKLKCDVCPRNCRLEEDQTGFCGVRKNAGGKNVDELYQLVNTYAATTTFRVYAVCLPGCNLKCSFCAAPEYSKPTDIQLSKLRLMDEERLVFLTKVCGRDGVSFFGGEPTLHFEYLLETARLCRERHLVTELSTNGYLSEWLAEKLAKVVDIIAVGIKASASAEYYRTKLGADAAVVLESARTFWNTGKFLTISNLTGPGLGTPEDEVAFAKWVVDSLSPDFPVWLEYIFKPGYDDEDTRYIREAIARLKQGGLTNVFPPELVCVND